MLINVMLIKKTCKTMYVITGNAILDLECGKNVNKK